MNDLEQRIRAIEERNAKVESDKAWETSIVRRTFLALLTYATAALFLWIAKLEPIYLNAAIPAGAYLLSTLSLPWIKRMWLGQFSKM